MDFIDVEDIFVSFGRDFRRIIHILFCGSNIHYPISIMLCGRILSAEAAVAAQRISVDHTKAALFRDIHCGTVARRLFHDTGKHLSSRRHL